MRFSNNENDEIKRARTQNPLVSQRALASKIYGSPTLISRSEASIYGAIRRYDRNQRQLVTNS